MFTLSRSATLAMALAVFLFGSAPARAEGTILSGMFDGSEPQIAALWDYYCSGEVSGYRQTDFKVSETGYYEVFDSFARMGGRQGGAFKVYQGSFNPAALEQNGVNSHIFTEGVTYVLVVQQCGYRESAWVVAFVGPGSVISPAVANVPSFTSGTFTKSDPTKSVPWQDAPLPYKQAGPIRVSRDGAYYFANLFGVNLELQVYTAPVDPVNPQANLVSQLNWSNPSVELQAGQNYYFVAQRTDDTKPGEFLYLMAPPAPLRINPGMSGTWYNPDTPGQGFFFLTVYEKLNQVFLGWFTFTDNPAPDDEYGHRWMTAFGKFEGPSADLDIEWTAGGAFDAAQPVPDQNVVGTMELEFNDCTSGQVSFSWEDDGTTSHVIPIRRHTDDAVALCESLYAGPRHAGTPLGFQGRIFQCLHYRVLLLRP